MEPEQSLQTQPDPADVEKNKVMAILAYIYILFLVPLLAAKDSKFAMYHANQGLVLFLLAVAVNIVSSVVFFLSFLLLPIGNLLVIVLMVIGILNAYNGKQVPLPLIGSIQLIK